MLHTVFASLKSEFDCVTFDFGDSDEIKNLSFYLSNHRIISSKVNLQDNVIVISDVTAFLTGNAKKRIIYKIGTLIISGSDVNEFFKALFSGCLANFVLPTFSKISMDSVNIDFGQGYIINMPELYIHASMKKGLAGELFDIKADGAGFSFTSTLLQMLMHAKSVKGDINIKREPGIKGYKDELILKVPDLFEFTGHYRTALPVPAEGNKFYSMHISFSDKGILEKLFAAFGVYIIDMLKNYITRSGYLSAGEDLNTIFASLLPGNTITLIYEYDELRIKATDKKVNVKLTEKGRKELSGFFMRG